jgi:hypothetical protein
LYRLFDLYGSAWPSLLGVPVLLRLGLIELVAMLFDVIDELEDEIAFNGFAVLGRDAESLTNHCDVLHRADMLVVQAPSQVVPHIEQHYTVLHNREV